MEGLSGGAIFGDVDAENNRQLDLRAEDILVKSLVEILSKPLPLPLIIICGCVSMVCFTACMVMFIIIIVLFLLFFGILVFTILYQ
jgi:hypothetical protein